MNNFEGFKIRRPKWNGV